jgi:hypothetical protein
MFKRLLDAASTAIEMVTSGFASAGEKRQREALEDNNDGGGSAAATGVPVSQHSVTVNQHAL